MENDIDYLITSNYPTQDITIADTDLKDSNIYFKAENLDGLTYPVAELYLENVTYKENHIFSDERHPLKITEKSLSK